MQVLETLAQTVTRARGSRQGTQSLPKHASEGVRSSGRSAESETVLFFRGFVENFLDGGTAKAGDVEKTAEDGRMNDWVTVLGGETEEGREMIMRKNAANVLGPLVLADYRVRWLPAFSVPELGDINLRGLQKQAVAGVLPQPLGATTMPARQPPAAPLDRTTALQQMQRYRRPQSPPLVGPGSAAYAATVGAPAEAQAAGAAPGTSAPSPGATPVGQGAAAMPGTPGHAATNVIDQHGGLDPRGLTVDGNNAAGVRKFTAKYAAEALLSAVNRNQIKAAAIGAWKRSGLR